MVYTDGTHLVADTLIELHKFADKIGLKREWFQDHQIPHYDIFGCKIKRALEAGVVAATTRELIKMKKK